MTTTNLCRNRTCGCPVKPGAAYCDVYCENVDKGQALPGMADFKGQCACGHRGCHHLPDQPSPQSNISIGLAAE